MSDLPPTWPHPGGSTPPPSPPPAPPARRPIALWIALTVAVALLVGVGVTAVVVLTEDEQAVAGEPVLLEHAADTGPDPFVSPVAITPVPTFPDEVRAVSATTAGALPVDPVTGTRSAVGTTEALYGGSGDLGTCDPDQLVDFLAANPAPAAAWAGVHDIAPDRIGDYVATLTPVVLLYDTAVTNYGFHAGTATPRQSVLQAGTAVLVDATGVPAVRCACGNPLTAPTVRDLPAAQLQGTRWDAVDPAAALTVAAGPRATSFTLVDIATGQTYQRPAGPARLSRPALLAATPAGVQRSTDTQRWDVVGVVDRGAVGSLDASEDLVVAVGGVRWDGANQPSGVILTSTDGSTWSEPIAVQDHLLDVAFGNGSWLALGGPAADRPRHTVPIYRSDDGVTWQREEVSLPGEHSVFDLDGSIEFGGDAWFIPAADNVGEAGIPILYRSTDGVTWTDVAPQGDSRGVPDARSFNGQTWGITGAQLFYDNGLDQPPRQELRVSGSADGATWQPVPGTPTQLRVIRLSCTAERGWLGAAVDTTAPDWIGAVHTSADLVSWTPLGTGPEGGVTDVIAVGARSEPDAATCGTPPGSSSPPPSAGGSGAACALDQPAADGQPTFAVPVTGTISCEVMRDRWTAYFNWTGPKLGTAAAAEVGDGWTCSVIPLSATLPGQTDWGYRGQLGGCSHVDGNEFTVYPEDRMPAGRSGAPSTSGATPTSSAEGDLGVSQPISRPACDGSGIVVVASAIHPASYAADVQDALNRFPGSRYLRTDLTGCTSLNQVSSSGTRIYAVYLPVGTDVPAICAEAGRTGGYGKWLDNTTSPGAQIDCG